MNFDGGAVVAAVTAVVGVSSGAVVLYQKATSAEMRLLIERMRREIIEHINGKYMKREECPFREETVHSLLLLLRKDAKDTE